MVLNPSNSSNLERLASKGLTGGNLGVTGEFHCGGKFECDFVAGHNSHSVTQ